MHMAKTGFLKLWLKDHAFVMYFCCALLHQIYYHLAFRIKLFNYHLNELNSYFPYLLLPENYVVESGIRNCY